MRERHEAVSVAEMAFAFRAIAKSLKFRGDDEVLGLQRMKHHNLRGN
jgi:hypothetical protein